MGVQLNEDRYFVLTANVGTLEEVSANTTEELTVTVKGLKTTDMIVGVSKPTHQAGLGITGARVSAADTLAITFMNPTGSGVTPTASESYKVFVFRPEKTYTAVPA